MGTDSLMAQENLARVDWALPGMDKFDSHYNSFFQKAIRAEELVWDVSCAGWAYWPIGKGGYLDQDGLRALANFIEIQNKPIWDEYERYYNAK